VNEHPASISAIPPSVSALPTSIPALIDRWQSIGVFAADVGCGYEAARQMRHRGRIGPQHWARVVAANHRRGVAGVSCEWLAGHRAVRKGRRMNALPSPFEFQSSGPSSSPVRTHSGALAPDPAEPTAPRFTGTAGAAPPSAPAPNSGTSCIRTEDGTVILFDAPWAGQCRG